MNKFPEIFKHLNKATLDEQLIENLIAQEEINQSFTKIENKLEKAEQDKMKAEQA